MVPESLPKSAQRLLARSHLCVGGYLALCDRFGLTPRNDTGWRHLPGWVAQAEPHLAPATGRRVLMFAVHPRWVDYCLALAVLLAAAGDQVDLAWLPEAHHLPDRPEPILYRYWLAQGRATQRRFRHARLRLIDLATTPPAVADAAMRDDAGDQALLDASYALRRERLDLRDGSPDQAEIGRRAAANLEAIRRIATLLDAQRYDRLILPNGGVLQFGAIDRFARRRGLPVTSFEFPDARDRILVADDGPVVNIRTAASWAEDAPHRLTEERRRRITAQLIERRENGADARLPSFQRAPMAGAAAVRRQLGLPEDGRRVVLVCANVPYDAIFYASPKRLFDGMWQWLIETCRFLAARNDCYAVVRAHPAEPRFDTPETAEALLVEALPEPPPRIRFVAPTAPLNTFAIMRIADLGLVYASTTGLEMAMRGIPVVCGNPFQHYNGKGFTIDPAGRADYFVQIDRLLAAPTRPRLTERQVELALCYADVYFNRWPRPFPWQLASFWSDLRRHPLAAVVTPQGREAYAEALTLF